MIVSGDLRLTGKFGFSEEIEALTCANCRTVYVNGYRTLNSETILRAIQGETYLEEEWDLWGWNERCTYCGEMEWVSRDRIDCPAFDNDVDR